MGYVATWFSQYNNSLPILFHPVVTVVGSVCLSTPQLTSRWFVCPRNDATHSSDNKNQFNCMAERAPLLRYLHNNIT